MNSSPYSSFQADLQREARQLYVHANVSGRIVASKLGISATTIERWILDARYVGDDWHEAQRRHQKSILRWLYVQFVVPSIGKAAALAGVSPRTVRRWMAESKAAGDDWIRARCEVSSARDPQRRPRLFVELHAAYGRLRGLIEQTKAGLALDPAADPVEAERLLNGIRDLITPSAKRAA